MVIARKGKQQNIWRREPPTKTLRREQLKRVMQAVDKKEARMDLDAKEVSGTCKCGTVPIRVRMMNGDSRPAALRLYFAGCAAPSTVAPRSAICEVTPARDQARHSINSTTREGQDTISRSRCGIIITSKARSDPASSGSQGGVHGGVTHSIHRSPVMDGVIIRDGSA